MLSDKPFRRPLPAASLKEACFDHWLPALAPPRAVLPLFTCPSPADGYIVESLDLNELLEKKPAATFFVRAQEESMLGAGIHPNDILVVDRSIEPVPGKIVICALNGSMTVKRLDRENQQWTLKAESSDYADIVIHEELDLVIWGVVTTVIHSMHNVPTQTHSNAVLKLKYQNTP